MNIRPGSICLSARAIDDYLWFHDIRAVPNLIWKDMFTELGLRFEETVPLQLKNTEMSTGVFVSTPALLLDEELMHCVRRLLDSNLHGGYHITELKY